MNCHEYNSSSIFFFDSTTVEEHATLQAVILTQVIQNEYRFFTAEMYV